MRARPSGGSYIDSSVMFSPVTAVTMRLPELSKDAAVIVCQEPCEFRMTAKGYYGSQLNPPTGGRSVMRVSTMVSPLARTSTSAPMST